MTRWLAGFSMVLLLALGACSGDDGGPSPEPPNPCPSAVEQFCDGEVASGALPEAERGACLAGALRDCSTHYYLRDYPALAQPSCVAGASVVPIDASVDLGLFRGLGVSDGAVVEQTYALQRYYEPHALWFFADAPSSSIGLGYPMDGSESQLREALMDAGIPLDRPLSPEEELIANQIVGDIVFAPLRAFVLEHAVPKQSRVLVVTVSRIVSPALEQALTLELEIAGLGLSPALLNAVTAEDPQSDLYELLGLPAEFSPLLFVASGVTRKYTSTPDNLIAHEMGHALGLVHTLSSGNLMTQGSPVTCRTSLDPGQTGTITLPHLAAHPPGYRLLSELRRRLLDRVLPLR